MELFKKKKIGSLSKDEMAQMLKISPEAFKAFEDVYSSAALDDGPDDIFSMNSRQAADSANAIDDPVTGAEGLDDLIGRIVDEFIIETPVYCYKRGQHRCVVKPACLPDKEHCVKKTDIEKYSPEQRPQCTAFLQKRDIDSHASDMLLLQLRDVMDPSCPPGRKKLAYDMFRQGLDILDIDPILYEMLGMNRISMGYWLPKIVSPVEYGGFFKIPETTIIKVPMNMLQLTRTEYSALTHTTMEIINRFCTKVFDLKEDGDYFIKTGTYSSKFDFRNCRVNSPKEVRELGEYLLFIQYQASQMAGPLNIDPVTGRSKCIYGVSTTNEWVVREYIPDTENNPCIYKGLPLHTEYRIFVDFDNDEILSVCPYWDPETMKKRFAEGADRSVHDLHDYVIYKAHEDVLMERYDKNKDLVTSRLEDIIPDINIPGQWSVDIMQNGDDFWLIDMAVAENSAFYDSIPVEKRRRSPENWLPDLSSGRESGSIFHD